jgi:hypothetical protein
MIVEALAAKLLPVLAPLPPQRQVAFLHEFFERACLLRILLKPA